MKTIKLPKSIFRLIVFIPLAVMGISLWLAYVQYTQPDRVVLPPYIGTLKVDTDWRVRLKDNPFYATSELDSKYAYISELVDHILIDLDFTFSDGKEDAQVAIDYQVNGVLQAEYGAANLNMLLLQQDYPKISSGAKSFSGSAFSDTESFQLQLSPYTYVIDSFQSAYKMSVVAKLNLNIAVNMAIQVSGQTINKDLKLNLIIPLGNTVFQITGTPSGSLELYLPLNEQTESKQTMQQMWNFIILSGVMMLLALLCYMFLEPRKSNPNAILLKQTLQKYKSRMVALEVDPREGTEKVLPVSDISGLICIADESGQPVLYKPIDENHFFFVLVQGVLYSYEIKGAPSSSPALEKVQH